MIIWKHFQLRRTGGTPFSFVGACLADEGGPYYAGHKHSRWINLALYRTRSGRYVIAVTYCTRCAGEPDWHAVLPVQNAAGVGDALRTFDPIPPELTELLGLVDPQGEPPIVGTLRRMYEDRTSGVLMSLGEIMGAGR